MGSTNLSIDFLSFESSDEEKDVINVHSLPWRCKSKRSRDYCMLLIAIGLIFIQN